MRAEYTPPVDSINDFPSSSALAEREREREREREGRGI
jgi:hypothetical protein